MRIVIDPGVKAAGVAIFEDGELTAAWLARGADWRETAFEAHTGIRDRYPRDVWELAEIVIEVPQIYTQNKLKGDPNDLIDVALMAACFVGFMRCASITEYRPHQWKGQVPKNIMTKRTQEKLSVEERGRVELPTARSLQHNVWDVIGIGLYHERKVRRGGHKGAEKSRHQLRDRRG